MATSTPYDWLRDTDDPDVIAYYTDENAYTHRQTEHLSALQATLLTELRDAHASHAPKVSVPVRIGQWWYFTRRRSEQRFDVHCRLPIRGAEDWEPPQVEAVSGNEEVFFDTNEEAQGQHFFALGSFDISSNGKLLAYAIDTRGDERYVLRIRDLHSGRDFPFSHANTAAGATLSYDGKHLYFATKDRAWRSSVLWRYDLNTETMARLIDELDLDRSLRVSLTRSRRYLRVISASLTHSRLWLIDQADPTGEPMGFDHVTNCGRAVIDHIVLNGSDYFMSICEEQQDGSAVIALHNSLEANCKCVTLVSAGSGMTNIRLSVFEHFVALYFRRDGSARAGVLQLDSQSEASDAHNEASSGWSYTTPIGTIHELQVAEGLAAVGDAGNPDWTQPRLRLSVSTFLAPASTIAFDVSRGDLVSRDQSTETARGVNHYRQIREWAVAADGTQIPISIVWRNVQGESAATRPVRPMPLLLYGYGAYGAVVDPSYSTSRVALLDRGVAFAVAHVRGGGEFGVPWHEQGRKQSKTTTFTDFVACAERLVEAGWAIPGRIVAEGHSAGGLLVAAAARLAPALFAGVLAQAPFVDPLTTLLDPSLPLSASDWNEFGDPVHDNEAYRTIKSYSPCENPAAGYPPVLAIGSLHDTRVSAGEPAKWVAQLREAGSSALSWTLMQGGHAGIASREEGWREQAFELSWTLERLGAVDLIV